MNRIFNMFSSYRLGGDFEGDILIPRLGVSETIQFSLIHLESSLMLIQRGVAARGDYVRWPNGTVPYYISPAYGMISIRPVCIFDNLNN